MNAKARFVNNLKTAPSKTQSSSYKDALAKIILPCLELIYS
jgi:hypothetical protein